MALLAMIGMGLVFGTRLYARACEGAQEFDVRQGTALSMRETEAENATAQVRYAS
jgi:hypothetical protein